jgi:glycosyltransferase involved in cell wall biosynthesis
MKILLLADCNQPHTIKWAKALSAMSNAVVIFSLQKCNANYYDGYDSIDVHSVDYDASLFRPDANSLARIKYLKALPKLRRLIKQFKPDIVHSHYATSYGFLGAVSGFSPYILSVWGSDIYIFPHKSFLHRLFIKYNLSKADRILSTSHALAEETSKYTDTTIDVIPFGINMEVFKPLEYKNPFGDECIIIGTVKSLETVYGIEYLIEAFNILKHKYSDLPLKLFLVGGGTRETHLKQLVSQMGLAKDTLFTGKVPYDKVPMYHNMISIYVALSLSESFGVSIIEASACEKPVVVSDVGGLPEVVNNGVTGFIVESGNVQHAVEAIEKLILNDNLRQKMGRAGRTMVAKRYNLDDSLNRMMAIYSQVLNR